MTPPSVVLLHGWGHTARVWSGLIDALPAGLAVRMPELPGHGSAARVPDRTLSAWSDSLLPAIPHGSVVCGWSLGGLIALDLARRYPGRISRLVLIGASPCFVACKADTARTAWPFGLEAATVRGFLDDFLVDPAASQRRFVALQALGDVKRHAVSLALGAALADTADTRALGDGLHLLADADVRQTVTAIGQPARILHGAHDALMPLAGARWLANQLPDARLTVFDDCGHAPFLSRPADCAMLIGEFALGRA